MTCECKTKKVTKAVGYNGGIYSLYLTCEKCGSKDIIDRCRLNTVVFGEGVEVIMKDEEYPDD